MFLRSGLGLGKALCSTNFPKMQNYNRILVEIQFSGDEFIKRLIRLYWGLGDKEKAIIRQLINDLADKEKSPGN